MLEFRTVKARGLTKLYGATRALGGVDVEIHAGEVTCLLGPNGSGKSTLVQILSLLAKPTRGEVLFGNVACTSSTRANLAASIGVVAHASMVYPDLTGIENLAFFAALRGHPHDKTAIDALCARFELGAFTSRQARTYSRGQLQRIALACALLHRPQFVLLDEPSTGLDAAATSRLEAIVHEEKSRGAIVLVVTHDTAFADAVGTKRIRLERGRVLNEAAS